MLFWLYASSAVLWVNHGPSLSLLCCKIFSFRTFFAFSCIHPAFIPDLSFSVAEKHSQSMKHDAATTMLHCREGGLDGKFVLVI